MELQKKLTAVDRFAVDHSIIHLVPKMLGNIYIYVKIYVSIYIYIYIYVCVYTIIYIYIYVYLSIHCMPFNPSASWAAMVCEWIWPLGPSCPRYSHPKRGTSHGREEWEIYAMYVYEFGYKMGYKPIKTIDISWYITYLGKFCNISLTWNVGPFGDGFP